MEDSMACPRHPNDAYVNVNGSLICPVCGQYSPYQPKPKYEDLLAENEQLKKRIKELEEICQLK